MNEDVVHTNHFGIMFLIKNEFDQYNTVKINAKS